MYIYIHIHIHIHLHILILLHVHTHIHIHTHTHMQAHMCIHDYIHINTHKYTYTYEYNMYIYIQSHAHIYIYILYCSSFCQGVSEPPGNLATIVINDSHYLISSAHIERSSSNVTDDDASYVASISEDYMISGMLVDSIFYIVSDVTGLSAAQFACSFFRVIKTPLDPLLWIILHIFFSRSNHE